MPRRAVPVALAVALLAACGTVDRGPYKLEPTRRCLHDEGLRLATRGLGVIAESAPGGALRTFVGTHNATLSFADTNRSALGIARAYKKFGPPHTADLLFVERNVVLVWDVTPDDDTRGKVDGCLRS